MGMASFAINNSVACVSAMQKQANKAIVVTVK
jgi:hypothetical protein